MKTIEINLYEFSELSAEIQEKVIEKYRETNQKEGIPWQSEIEESFEKFANIFNIQWELIDYEEPDRNRYSVELEDNIKELTGLRLAKYIWNNYKSYLYKGKYYFLWSKKEPYHALKSRRSKILLDNCCVLTGVCYDDELLHPIYDFLENPNDNVNFEKLLENCIDSLCESIQKEIDYINSDETIIEEIEANEYTFEINGKMNNG